MFGKIADTYAQVKDAADLAVRASDAAEGFAGETRESIATVQQAYADTLVAEEGAVSAYEGAVTSQEAAEGFANDARDAAYLVTQKAPPTVVTLVSGQATNLAYGKVYACEPVGEFDLSGMTITQVGCTVEIWMRPAGETNVTWPAEWKWLEGQAPVLVAGTTYYICVRRDLWQVTICIGTEVV